MAAEPEFLAFLQDQFERFGDVNFRRMFGGTGLFRDGVMFGIVARDTLFLKTDDRSRSKYESAGMGPFQYERKGKTLSLGYHEVPVEVLEDGDTLAEWASSAHDVALNAKNRKSRKNKSL